MAKKNGEADAAGAGEEGARDFGVFLRNVNEGRFLNECARELHELVRAIREHAQRNKKSKGTLTIKLTLMHESDTIAIMPDVKATPPAKERGATWMFLTEGGNLSLDRDRQTEIPLRAVPIAPTKNLPASEAAAPKGV